MILQVYQQLRRGTKAYVQLDGHPWTRDAFFWWTPVNVGSMVVVTTTTGWGSHTNRNDVLWIGRERPTGAHGIHAVIPAADVKRWARHYRRLSKTTQRLTDTD